MKLQDIIATEGIWDGFKKGYTNVGGKELSVDWKAEKKSAPVKSADVSAKSPFDILSNSEAKEILAAILGQQPLDSIQKAKLQRVYDKL